MRGIAPMLLAVILLSNVACARPQTDSANANSLQTNRGQWQPSTTIPGGFRRDLIGDPRQSGPFKYQLKFPAGARVTAHQHSQDVHVKVLSGSMFIIIGEPLESSRAQCFVAGSVFLVPARAWHDEVVEAEGVGPMETVYKS